MTILSCFKVEAHLELCYPYVSYIKVLLSVDLSVISSDSSYHFEIPLLVRLYCVKLYRVLLLLVLLVSDLFVG